MPFGNCLKCVYCRTEFGESALALLLEQQAIRERDPTYPRIDERFDITNFFCQRNPPTQTFDSYRDDPESDVSNDIDPFPFLGGRLDRLEFICGCGCFEPLSQEDALKELNERYPE